MVVSKQPLYLLSLIRTDNMKNGIELLNELKADLQRSKEVASERSDKITSGAMDLDDCFLSVEANRVGQEVLRAKINILENKGLSTFQFLADMKGRVLDAKEINGRYGYCWIINMNGSSVFCPSFNMFGREANKVYKKYGCKNWDEVKETQGEKSQAIFEEAQNAFYKTKGYQIVYEQRPAWVSIGSNKGGTHSFADVFESHTNYFTGEENKANYGSNN